ncbi:MAG TPA: hypothetical protein VGF24_03590 [Vicinamibacterales bacterium]|jgi:hypothetical protein
MPYRRCPKCGRDGKLLQFSSTSEVSYFRCDPCHHFWLHEHLTPQNPPRDVSQPPDKRTDSTLDFEDKR